MCESTFHHFTSFRFRVHWLYHRPIQNPNSIYKNCNTTYNTHTHTYKICHRFRPFSSQFSHPFSLIIHRHTHFSLTTEEFFVCDKNCFFFFIYKKKIAFCSIQFSSVVFLCYCFVYDSWHE